MTRADIDWDKLTATRAKRLAHEAERKAAKWGALYNINGLREFEDKALEFATLAEDLTVFALTGERP
jgi:hypothetical protein